MSALHAALDKALSDRVDSFTNPVIGSVEGKDGDTNVLAFPQSKEKSLNRAVGMMALEAASVNQIADTFGLTIKQVESIMESTEVLELFRRQMAARGRYVVKNLLRGAATDAVLVVQKLARRPVSPEEVPGARLQLAACKELLDRAYGKPTQKVHLDEDLGEGDPEQELQLVQQQILELQKRRDLK